MIGLTISSSSNRIVFGTSLLSTLGKHDLFNFNLVNKPPVHRWPPQETA